MPGKINCKAHTISVEHIQPESIYKVKKKIKYQKMGCLFVLDTPSELHM